MKISSFNYSGNTNKISNKSSDNFKKSNISSNYDDDEFSEFRESKLENSEKLKSYNQNLDAKVS